ncbi:MAG TPA: hypothetical protein VLH35_04215 [Candidatus Acidoferrales bacterium]|nr:hypothetical protein [Candidatus Acidoferrales bacterium]
MHLNLVENAVLQSEVLKPRGPSVGNNPAKTTDLQSEALNPMLAYFLFL